MLDRFLSESGDVLYNFTQAKKVLDLFKKLSLGRKHPDQEALSVFNQVTADATDMSKYQDLLSKAVAAITGKSEEKGIESLFHRGGTVITKDSFKGIDDFEVVSYLIVVGENARQ